MDQNTLTQLITAIIAIATIFYHLFTKSKPATPATPVDPKNPGPAPVTPVRSPSSDPFSGLPLGLPGHPVLNGLLASLPNLLRLFGSAAASGDVTPSGPASSSITVQDALAVDEIADAVKRNPAAAAKLKAAL